MAGLAWAGNALGQAGPAEELPPVPEEPAAERYRQVPDPWRDYMIAVRAAYFIEDPLERCIAFPDMPGNRWPEGHAEAHCRYHFEPTISLDEAEALIREGLIAELESVVAEYQLRHGGGDHLSTAIHRFWTRFEDDPEQAARVAEGWLQARPASALANLAKAQVLLQAGWAARGGAFAARTPGNNFRRMRTLMDEAVPYYQRAIELDPALMDAYIGLMSIARADSRDELEAWAFAQGRSVDPGCSTFALGRMNSLTPRWGGSHEAGAAYAESLRPLLKRRPMLANALAFPYSDAAGMLFDQDQYGRHAADLLEVAVRTASAEDGLRRAGQLAVFRNDGGPTDSWRGVALYLQQSRFDTLTMYARRVIGEQLIRLEPEWAVAELIQAHRADPASARIRYYLGAAYYNSGWFETAELHYLQALIHEDHRQASLRELSSMWLYDAGLPQSEAVQKASPHIDRLLREYPSDGRAHLMNLARMGYENGYVDHEAIQAFLEIADENDPQQKRAADAFRRTSEP